MLFIGTSFQKFVAHAKEWSMSDPSAVAERPPLAGLQLAPSEIHRVSLILISGLTVVGSQGRLPKDLSNAKHAVSADSSAKMR